MSDAVGGSTDIPNGMTFQVVVQPRITLVAVIGNERRPILELSRNTAAAMTEQLQAAVRWYDQLPQSEPVVNDTGIPQ